MWRTHHEVSWQEFLQKLCLLVLHSLDDELVVTGDVEERSAGTRVGQLDQSIVTQRVLQGTKVDTYWDSR